MVRRNCARAVIRSALILSGLSVGLVLPTSAMARTGGPQWTSFTDPDENAFAVEVPAGWKVTGGTERISPIAAVPWVATSSPDGSIQVFFGDPEVPTFRTPTAGQQEGAQVKATNAYLPPGIALNYRTGTQFAEIYGPPHLAAAGCTGATRTGTEALPALAQADLTRVTNLLHGIVIQGTYTPPPHDAGLATYTCQFNGRPMSAAIIADTAQPVGGFWTVAVVAGFLAAPGQEEQATEVLNHMLGSRQWNPKWDDAMRDEAQKAINQLQQEDADFEKMLQRQSADFTNMLIQNGKNFEKTMTDQHNAFMAQMAAQGKANTAKFEADEKQKDLFAWQVEGASLGGGLVRDPKTGNLFQTEPDVGLVIPRGK